ncbi:hypothetical protein [Vibrio vulnificus YJ016]|uniref:Uncharacterized protein n=1 Tax=Vibrio vulnificus (strain YJ016) TaxID=196600 RepID=Q7MDE7_VIBVY|nr:hypothetical protein [Vibrio vulnificus YJ016]
MARSVQQEANIMMASYEAIRYLPMYPLANKLRDEVADVR